MNSPAILDEQTGRAWLDRLASGDLPERDRRELFTWLESDPARWRHCALALLEARELEQALHDLHHEPTLPETSGVPEPILPQRPVRSRRSAAWPIAAAALLAFGGGLVVRGLFSGPGGALPDNPSGSGSLVQKQDPPHAASESDAALADSPAVTALGNPPANPDRPAAPDELDEAEMPSYVRSQWEKQGYRVTQHQELVKVDLPDGRQVEMPVDQVRFQFVGQRVY